MPMNREISGPSAFLFFGCKADKSGFAAVDAPVRPQFNRQNRRDSGEFLMPEADQHLIFRFASVKAAPVRRWRAMDEHE